jgi:site-specific recombinase XerD
LLLFLYATGAHLGEAIALKVKDLDVKGRKATLCGIGFSQNRCIPISADLVEVLQHYLTRRSGSGVPDSPLFT